MKKGFTLIELLAVITVLGIISTLSFVLVDKYIDNVEESAVKESLKNVKNTAKTYFTNNNVKKEMFVDLTTNEIKLNNDLIKKGEVWGSRKIVKAYLYQNGYCGYIEGENIIVKKTAISECNWDINDKIKVVDNRPIMPDENIVGYIIYGNTVDSASLGKYEQLAIMQQGKNILDSSTIVRGGINSSGVEIDSQASLRSAIIKVEPGDMYKLTIDSICEMNDYYMIHFYDQNKKWISTSNYAYVNSITVPAEAEYMRIIIQKKDYNENFTDEEVAYIQKSKSQLEKGSQATEFEKYVKSNNLYVSFDGGPLRKYEDAVDYMDSRFNLIVRNVGVNSDGSLYKLTEPKYEHVEFIIMDNINATKNVSVYDPHNMIIKASKIQLVLSN